MSREDGRSRGSARTGFAAGATALAIVASLSAVGVAADPAAFDKGRALFEERRFEEAAEVFEALVAREPDVSEHHRWLGMSYGRLAEHGAWISAPSRVSRAHDAFERALALDPLSIPALETLMDFHENAPSLFGGDDARAEALGVRIRQLEAREIEPF